MIFSSFGAYSVFAAFTLVILVFGFIYEEKLRDFEDRVIEKIRSHLKSNKKKAFNHICSASPTDEVKNIRVA